MSRTAPLEPDDAAGDAIVGIQDVSVVYGMERGQSRVLNHVSIDVNRNEILGIVGESGSGKSMLASSLLDAVPQPGEVTGEITYYPDDGRDPISVLDLDTDALRRFRWEEIAMVFQGAMSSFNPTMSIRGHFEETIEAHDLDMIEQMEHARQLLADVYLDPDRVLDVYPHEISGGMRQRALIALSLVLDPEVLVMDEPTAALDLLMQRSITNLLAGLRDKYDLTILFITHDLPLVAGLVDRLSVLYAFEFVEEGPVDDVLLNAAHPYTRALLGSVPSIDASIEEMEPIPGRSPDPVNVPEGCSYHTRCPIAEERCELEDPEMMPTPDTTAADHDAACFYPERAVEAVPYTIPEGVEGTADSEGGQ